MSKRHNQFGSRATIHKKPRLEFCGNNATQSSKNKVIHPPPNPKPTETDSLLWGDDDEDVIFLTKVADEFEQFSQQNLAGNSSSQRLTFTNFRKDVKTVTSTQIKHSDDKILEDFFEGGDEAFISFGEDLVTNHDDKLKKVELLNEHDFKPPGLVVFEAKPSTSNFVAKDNNAPIRKDPKELQINYLRTRLDESEKKNNQLSKDISDLADKIQTKEGEVSILRHKLEHLKQMNDKLRLEKMQDSETFRKEWQYKIEDLEKQLKLQQAELEFKNVEISHLKTKRLNDTQRLNASICDLRKDYQSLPSILQLHLSTEFHRRLRLDEPIPEDIFKKSPDTIFSFRENALKRYLKQLQSILAQIHTHKVLNQHSVKSLSSKVLEICKSVIPAVLDYVKDLEYPPYRDTSSFVEYKFLCKELDKYPSCSIHKEVARNIFQEQPLYPSEKVIVIRRIFAALSLICKRLTPVWVDLCSEKSKECTLMEILIEAIHLLGYSREIFHHNGLVASFAALLNSISTCDLKEKKKILSNYVKNVIFCRPSGKALLETSQFLRSISSNSTDLLNTLCIQSDANSCFSADYYKMLQFTPGSCALQVYSALLAGSFRQHEGLQHESANELANICYNHIKFIRNSFDHHADWIIKASSQSSCDCFVQTASTFIILLHLVLNQWITDPKTIDMKKISKIARAASVVLYDILYKYFKKGILLVHGSAVKHRLQLAYDWLHEHKTLFRFRRPHLKSIESIYLPQIMADPLKNPTDVPKSQAIADGNKIWNDTFEQFF